MWQFKYKPVMCISQLKQKVRTGCLYHIKWPIFNGNKSEYICSVLQKNLRRIWSFCPKKKVGKLKCVENKTSKRKLNFRDRFSKTPFRIQLKSYLLLNKSKKEGKGSKTAHKICIYYYYYYLKWTKNNVAFRNYMLFIVLFHKIIFTHEFVSIAFEIKFL